MAAPTDLNALSVTAASNAPAGSDAIAATADDYLRAIQAVLRQGVHKGSDIASSGTTDLSGTVGSYHDITGTTTITSFGSTGTAGIVKILQFDGALTLTHGASLILPGAANITTVAGDVAVFVCEGSGVWRCVSYAGKNFSANNALVAGTLGVTGNVTINPGYVGIGTSVVSGTGITIDDPSATTNAKGIKINDLTNGSSTNYGLHSSVTSGSGKYNLYIDGTAQNYLAGNTAFGATTSIGVAKISMRGSFTSDGSSNVAYGALLSADVTSASGDTGGVHQLGVTGSLTTAGATEVYPVVSGARFNEPNITVGSGDSITVAATVYITSAPTEGSTNAALYVASGSTILLGGLELGHASDTTLSRVSAGVVAIEGKNIGITLGTEQASTSGTAIDFTSIPAGVRRVTVMFNAVSTNGTSDLIVQIGDSGGVENTGYAGSSTSIIASSSFLVTTYPGAGFVVVDNAGAGGSYNGKLILTLEDSSDNTWSGSGVIGQDGGQEFTAGTKGLSAVLDRVRITTAGGVNTFDAGAINIAYEF